MIKDGLEKANCFSLRLASRIRLEKAPAERLKEEISGSHLTSLVLAEMGAPLITWEQWVAFVIHIAISDKGREKGEIKVV